MPARRTKKIRVQGTLGWHGRHEGGAWICEVVPRHLERCLGEVRRMANSGLTMTRPMARGTRAPPSSAAPEITVLVVEDDEDTRSSTAELLRAFGYMVATAANGREAAALVAHGRPPDVILLDLSMPVMSGWEFLLVVRRDRRLAGVPVIIVSGDRVVKKPGGCDLFLAKPVSPAVLLATIQHYVGSDRSRTAVE